MTDLGTGTTTDMASGAGVTGPGDGSQGMPRLPDILFDHSLRPKVRTERGGRFPFPIPNGWFIVAASEELEPGTLRPLHYFGRDLVLFRTAGGAPRVTSAYCAHQGAHLGVGGRVEGEQLVCPFHGWCYDGATGRCVNVPYGSGRIPSQAKVRALPTLERNRMIWAWFHLEGKPPFYDVPEVPEFDDPEWSEPYTLDFTINSACQELAENNHDPAHFRFVHGTPDIPHEEAVIDGTHKRVVGMGGAFIRETFGLGLGVLRITNHVTFLSSTTPIDDEGVQVRWIFLTPRAAGPDAAVRSAESFAGGVSQDIPIWENKRYVERPVLLKEERSIIEHRQWCAQFYSDPSRAID